MALFRIQSRQRTLCVFTALLGLLTSAPGWAQSPGATTKEEAEIFRPLSPAQLIAVRSVGRGVLAAKKSAIDNPDDAAQLARLRETVDALIAADFDPANRVPLTVIGEESAAQLQSRTLIAQRQSAIRSDAKMLSGQLRMRGGLMASRAKRGEPADTATSAGLPVGAQRAVLFEKLAEKLEAALADDNSERSAQLRDLSIQLRPVHGTLTQASIAPGTPTLQAMPAEDVRHTERSKVPK